MSNVSNDRRRWLWLVVGAVAALFAVGGRWDIPVAAWLFPVFLLRFARTSRPVGGLVLVWLVSWAGAMFWIWQMAVPMTGMTVLAGLTFGVVLALPYIADRLVAPRLGTAGELLLFPMAVVVSEFLLGTFAPFGTVVGLLANTQFGNLALSQVASVTGSYGIGFLVGGCATVVNWTWAHPPSWRTARVVGGYVAVLAVVVVGGAARMAWFPVDTTQTVRIAGLNANMGLIRDQMAALGRPDVEVTRGQGALPRFDPDTVRPESAAVIDDLFARTRNAARAGAKIVVWSENAAYVSHAGLPALLSRAQDIARQERIYLLVADNVHLPSPRDSRDETHLIGPDGAVLWTYQKSHPVPGLEPYRPGGGVAPVVDTPYGRLSSVICYDADFPAMMHADADIMLVPGGDWPEIGRTHSEMAGLRAIENGYSLIRQDYVGWSVAFDSHGNTLSTQNTLIDQDLWLVDVPVHGVTTPYRVIGDAFAWLCLAGTVVLIGSVFFRQHPPASRTPKPATAREPEPIAR
ncbi:nitrilase-related carbon-nitrogen hydrolase [Amycolatopsis sp. 3B14]|uniref:nitrilase-related carbon-nitrogen hydrolase n=1 Tax=Amycolatopsis sp. 3B14 TaxID=3243600 RepID=UPI003D95AEC3